MSAPKPNSHLLKLAKKWLAGKITEKEKLEFDQWYNSFDDSFAEVASDETEDQIEKRLQKVIFEKGNIQEEKQIRPMWYRVAAAAVILITLSTGVYFYMNQNTIETQVITKVEPLENDIAPGGNKAILTLANGSKIVLTDAANGKIANQAGITITKSADGQLVYTVVGQADPFKSTELVYNTITTPRGGQYQVNLPDGTKVWLNAASSLRYPAAFIGNERRVELTGEAYFEVAKNKAMPFLVSSNNQVVEVLGTHFNIMAYSDENSMKTTLLEGAVRIVKGQESKTITPGEQAIVKNNIEVESVNTDDVIAWKNGLTSFRNADIKTIMRQVARWYDIEVSYKGDIPERLFAGEIPRDVNISKLFKVLELNNIHFKLEGKKVTVLP